MYHSIVCIVQVSEVRAIGSNHHSYIMNISYVLRMWWETCVRGKSFEVCAG